MIVADQFDIGVGSLSFSVTKVDGRRDE